MTREIFLKDVLKGVLGYISIEYNYFTGNAHYYKKGNPIKNCKNCKYNQTAKGHIIELFMPILSSDSHKLRSYNLPKLSEDKKYYQKKAKDYIVFLFKTINCDLSENMIQKIHDLTIDELNRIYIGIIIEEIFKTDSTNEDPDKDDFEKSQIIICDNIKQAFLDINRNVSCHSTHNNIENIPEFSTIIYSNMEFQQYSNIKDYIKTTHKNYIDINQDRTYLEKLMPNTVYKYCNVCQLTDSQERNEIIVTIASISSRYKQYVYSYRQNWAESYLNPCLNTSFPKPIFLHCFFELDEADFPTLIMAALYTKKII